MSLDENDVSTIESLIGELAEKAVPLDAGGPRRFLYNRSDMVAWVTDALFRLHEIERDRMEEITSAAVNDACETDRPGD